MPWRVFHKSSDNVAFFPKKAWQCGVFPKRGLAMWCVFQKRPDNLACFPKEAWQYGEPTRRDGPITGPVTPLQRQWPHYRGRNNVQATYFVRPLLFWQRVLQNREGSFAKKTGNSGQLLSDDCLMTVWWLSEYHYWYGVATISRLLKIIRLFCKRAL